MAGTKLWMALSAVAAVCITAFGASAQTSAGDNPTTFSRPDFKPYDDTEQLRQENAKLVQDGAKALKEGDFATAEARFGKALQNNPDNAMLNYLMGVAKIGQGRKADAVGYLEKSVKNDPGNVEYRLLLARLLAEGGDLEGAREQLAAMKGMKSDCKESCDPAKLDAAIAMLESALA